jgi:hypothetical protein
MTSIEDSREQYRRMLDNLPIQLAIKECIRLNKLIIKHIDIEGSINKIIAMQKQVDKIIFEENKKK